MDSSKETDKVINDIKLDVNTIKGQVENIHESLPSITRRIDGIESTARKNEDGIKDHKYKLEDIEEKVDNLRSWKASNKIQVTALNDDNPDLRYSTMKQRFIKYENIGKLVVAFLGIGSLGAILSLIMNVIVLYKIFTGA